MPPSLSWKFTEKEFTEQVKDVKLFVKCIQAITLNHPPFLCGFASLREISMSDFRLIDVLDCAKSTHGLQRDCSVRRCALPARIRMQSGYFVMSVDRVSLHAVAGPRTSEHMPLSVWSLPVPNPQ
jgi:hypothetical protein